MKTMWLLGPARLSVLSALVIACGGGRSHDATPTTASTAASTPGSACFALASATHPAQPNAPEKVSVKHVLVKWSGAKNPVPTATRTREEACLRALAARDALRSGTDFDAVVTTYSDEPGAASRNGSLGSVERKALVPAFADVAFELAPGEFSDIVETDFGFHVIMRTQ